MTPRERLQTVLAGGIPDCVPACPDFSNMIPARMTGKPFWDLYLYNDPPIWEAYIRCAQHFDIDALMDTFYLRFPEEIDPNTPPWERAIVFRSPERIVTQRFYLENGQRIWAPTVDVYYVADPPTGGVEPARIGLSPVPERWEPLEGVKSTDWGPAEFARAKALLGEQGMLGAYVTSSCALGNADAIYRYYDHPELHAQWAAERVAQAEERFARIMALETKPDFLCVGGSGTLVFQTEEIFRQLAFPAVKRAIELATAAGFPTHIHSCGPEKALVKIMAEETDLTVIDPLEVPPMGDCDLAELKRLYGHKIVLKGNLHTTDVMLRGTVDDVVNASKAAIDAAAAGGRFILATGDQCGRDTPDANLRALVDTARTYGRY
ncbi:MAG: uroporphyrinogen decarboxylase family protein [Armatimonadota bacterium]